MIDNTMLARKVLQYLVSQGLLNLSCLDEEVYSRLLGEQLDDLGVIYNSDTNEPHE